MNEINTEMLSLTGEKLVHDAKKYEAELREHSYGLRIIHYDLYVVAMKRFKLRVIIFATSLFLFAFTLGVLFSIRT